MSDDEINAAMAEAIDADPHWKCAKDYCKDLNAMHEAEKVLTPKEEGVYFFTLKHLVGDLIWHRDTCRNYRATARQRAEAFLCALGKWKGAQP